MTIHDESLAVALKVEILCRNKAAIHKILQRLSVLPGKRLAKILDAAGFWEYADMSQSDTQEEYDDCVFWCEEAALDDCETVCDYEA